MKVLYCGTFDPVTLGHLDIITRASSMFSEVVVGILLNVSKTPLFDINERLEHLSYLTRDFENVEITSFSGLAGEYAKVIRADAILRGLRSVSDFESEMPVAQGIKEVFSGVETIFVPSSVKYSIVSSKMAREIHHFGGPLDAILPEYIIEKLKLKA